VTSVPGSAESRVCEWHGEMREEPLTRFDGTQVGNLTVWVCDRCDAEASARRGDVMTASVPDSDRLEYLRDAVAAYGTRTLYNRLPDGYVRDEVAEHLCDSVPGLIAAIERLQADSHLSVPGSRDSRVCEWHGEMREEPLTRFDGTQVGNLTVWVCDRCDGEADTMARDLVEMFLADEGTS
jgi:hypothetical protein